MTPAEHERLFLELGGLRSVMGTVANDQAEFRKESRECFAGIRADVEHLKRRDTVNEIAIAGLATADRMAALDGAGRVAPRRTTGHTPAPWQEREAEALRASRARETPDDHEDDDEVTHGGTRRRMGLALTDSGSVDVYAVSGRIRELEEQRDTAAAEARGAEKAIARLGRQLKVALAILTPIAAAAGWLFHHLVP